MTAPSTEVKLMSLLSCRGEPSLIRVTDWRPPQDEGDLIRDSLDYPWEETVRICRCDGLEGSDENDKERGTGSGKGSGNDSGDDSGKEIVNDSGDDGGAESGNNSGTKNCTLLITRDILSKTES